MEPTFADVAAVSDPFVRAIVLRRAGSRWVACFGGDHVPITEEQCAALRARGAKVLR